MRTHASIGPGEMGGLIRGGEIQFGGNRRLKLYGSLDCWSGKRMAVASRVFFSCESEALREGYRPCGHCMREAYHEWRAGQAPIR